jgi:hypothetical protein
LQMYKGSQESPYSVSFFQRDLLSALLFTHILLWTLMSGSLLSGMEIASNT